MSGERFSTEPQRRARLLAALAAFAAALALYARTLGHEFVELDLSSYITNNPHVLGGLTWDGFWWSWTSFDASNWHPLTWLSHMLDVELFKLRPAGHHAHNALLHALSSALVVLFLARAAGALGASFVCGLVFAVHPLHVESVAWIAERKDVLSGALGLASLLAWLGWAQHRSRAAWWAALLLYAASLAAKPTLVTMPFVLLLLDAWPLARLPAKGMNFWRGIWALVREKLPWFVLTVASSWVTVLAQRAGGAVQSLEKLPLDERFGAMLLAYATYLRRALWPHDLCLHHPIVRGAYGPALYAGAALLLVALTAIVWLQRRRMPWLVPCWLAFLGMLVPMIGIFVKVGSTLTSDRYMYLPLLPLTVALVWTARELVRARWARIALSAGAIAALVAVAVPLVATWRDTEAAARRALAVHPLNPVANGLLGHTLARRGDLQGALREQNEALRVLPGDVETRHDRGLTLLRLGRNAEAESDLRILLAERPNLVSAREHLAGALIGQGKVREARALMEDLARTTPPAFETWFNLGRARELDGDLPGARSAYERALTLAPLDARALVALARVEIDAGATEAAAPRITRALELDSRNGLALQQRARLTVLAGDEAAAIADLRAAAAALPGNAPVHLDLAWQLASARADENASPAEALELARVLAAQLGAAHAPAMDTLGLALARSGRFEDALAAARPAAARAREIGQADYAARIEQRIALYEAGRFERGLRR